MGYYTEDSMTILNNCSNSSSKKKNFHIEKLRSLAFKTLMHSLRNEFSQIVPEYAQSELAPEHVELIDFFCKAFFFIPKVQPCKRNAVAGVSVSAANSSCEIRKATLSELFGFNSFNKQFRERVFGDAMFALPLLLILDNYRHYRTKFKDEFKNIFEEFKTLCRNTVEKFELNEELAQLKKQCFKSRFVTASPSDIVEAKIIGFAREFGLHEQVVAEMKKHIQRGDLLNLFLVLVKHVQSPLSVAALKECFEFYLAMLKLKHYSGDNATLVDDAASTGYSCEIPVYQPQIKEEQFPDGDFYQMDSVPSTMTSTPKSGQQYSMCEVATTSRNDFELVPTQRAEFTVATNGSNNEFDSLAVTTTGEDFPVLLSCGFTPSVLKFDQVFNFDEICTPQELKGMMAPAFAFQEVAVNEDAFPTSHGF